MSKTIELSRKDILDKLPSSWAEVTYSDYYDKILKIIPEYEDNSLLYAVDSYIKVAAVFLDLSPEIIGEFPITIINDITGKLSFVLTKPVPLEKTKYNWMTKVEEPTYDMFILYLKVNEKLEKGDFSNLHTVLKAICNDKLTDEEIFNMPMDEAETGFFLLRKSMVKYLKRMALSLALKSGKKELKRKVSRLIRFKKT